MPNTLAPYPPAAFGIHLGRKYQSKLIGVNGEARSLAKVFAKVLLPQPLHPAIPQRKNRTPVQELGILGPQKNPNRTTTKKHFFFRQTKNHLKMMQNPAKCPIIRTLRLALGLIKNKNKK